MADAEDRGEEAGVRLGWKEDSGANDVAVLFRSQEGGLPGESFVEPLTPL